MEPSTPSQIWLELLQWSPLPVTLTEKLQFGPGETPEGELDGGISIGRNEAGVQDGVAARRGVGKPNKHYDARVISRLIRCTVPVPTLHSRAVLRMPVPLASSARMTASFLLSIHGRPIGLPLWVPLIRALAIPAWTRSTCRSRSCLASEDITASTSSSRSCRRSISPTLSATTSETRSPAP